MRIVYLVTRMSEWGGAQVHVRDLALRLQQLGHEVHIIAGDDGAIASVLRHANVPVYIVPEIRRAISIKWDPLAVWKLWRLLRQIQPDLVSCHSSKAGILGRIATTLTGIPVIFTAHGYAFTDTTSRLKSLFYVTLEGMMRFFSDYVITVSDYDRNKALEYHLINASRISTIHNGMPDIETASHKRPTPHHATCHLIMVARFAAQKDHATLLHALATLRELDWRLSLVGGGNPESVHALAYALNIQDRIDFLGQRADVAELLAQSDVFVLTTHWEGFPRSIVEAMRAGLPVIATNIAGVPEAVIDNVTGFLVPPQDPATVADKLRQLITRPELRKTMGTAARTTYLNAFTFDHMFQATARIYDKVVKQRKLLSSRLIEKPLQNDNV